MPMDTCTSRFSTRSSQACRQVLATLEHISRTRSSWDRRIRSSASIALARCWVIELAREIWLAVCRPYDAGHDMAASEYASAVARDSSMRATAMRSGSAPAAYRSTSSATRANCMAAGEPEPRLRPTGPGISVSASARAPPERLATTACTGSTSSPEAPTASRITSIEADVRRAVVGPPTADSATIAPVTAVTARTPNSHRLASTAKPMKPDVNRTWKNPPRSRGRARPTCRRTPRSTRASPR